MSVCVRACECVCVFVRQECECKDTHTIDCTRKWIGNAAYIVYVTSLAILRMVTARGKLAGVTNDKECASIAVREPCLSG